MDLTEVDRRSYRVFQVNSDRLLFDRATGVTALLDDETYQLFLQYQEGASWEMAIANVAGEVHSSALVTLVNAIEALKRQGFFRYHPVDPNEQERFPPRDQVALGHATVGEAELRWRVECALHARMMRKLSTCIPIPFSAEPWTRRTDGAIHTSGFPRHHRYCTWINGGDCATRDLMIDPRATHIPPPPKQSFARYDMTNCDLVTREEAKLQRSSRDRRTEGA